MTSPWRRILRFKTRKRSELENVSRRVENHDWEHGENWKAVKRQANQIFHTHQAVGMLLKLQADLNLDADKKRFQQIKEKLTKAMGKCD